MSKRVNDECLTCGCSVREEGHAEDCEFGPPGSEATDDVGKYFVLEDRLKSEADNQIAQVCMRYLDGSIERPALLAALLDSAGAIPAKLEIDDIYMEVGQSGDLWWIPKCTPTEGQCVGPLRSSLDMRREGLLPVPEDTE